MVNFIRRYPEEESKDGRCDIPFVIYFVCIFLITVLFSVETAWMEDANFFV